ncbi:MAG TPA: CRISPR system precrRNA processing endoribonuclease RAMP protein Cas6 [Oscillospiraceae bacterium]|nr:CRISPR system precrRNA processing endoribonuclease RAMP protein Cas6 [Oscillospiraceae bacterium]
MKQYKFNINYDGRFSYSWGYSLYSSFLEQMNEKAAEEIHEDTFFNQYLTPTHWVINSNTDIDFSSKYDLEKYKTTIHLSNKEILEVSEQALSDKYLVNEALQKNVRLFFQTPTTFKQNNAYVLFPSEHLIMQSLTNKWNSWAKVFFLEDMVWDCCSISKYNLRTINYNLKNTKIKGFVGYVDLFFWGTESINRLGNLICSFSEYSGIGIKSALGMGGCKFE